MKTLEYFTTDKSQWARGEWDNEPDKVQWKDSVTGYPCLIVRSMLGSLCGYVGIPNTHPAYEEPVDDVGVEVHGGLTFSHRCTDTSMYAYERAKANFEESRKAMVGFPEGDDAQRVKEWEPVMGSYETWLARMQETAICHLDESGDDDNIWWLGFDCAHWNDYVPGMSLFLYALEEQTYKNIAFVKHECASLAKQLQEMEE